MKISALVAAILLLTVAVPLTAGTVSVPTPQVDARFERTSTGERMVAPGYAIDRSPSDPAVPSKEIHVILPPDADPNSVSVSLAGATMVVLPEMHDLAPSPPLLTSDDEATDWGGDKQIENGRNLATYQWDAFYPASHVEMVRVGAMRKWRIAVVRYYPYLYNPVSGVLELASGGDIVLSFATTSVKIAAASAADSILTDQVESLAANYDDAKAWYSAGTRPTTQASTGYVIVTTSAIVQGSAKLQAFAAHKAARGFTVSVVTESQWGGGTGDVAANRIRAWLKSNYLTKGIKYVLLVGNPHPSTGDTPMKMLWPRYDSTTYREAPSDYFYADLTGNWDRNGNGVYGELGDFGSNGIDLYPEVIVGRIPYYGSFTDLDSILQKTIDYESGGIGGSWVRKVLATMKSSDANTPGYQLGEAIKSAAANPAGFTTTRVYEQAFGLSPAPEVTPCTYTTCLAAAVGHHGFWFWWTHGNETLADQIMSSDRVTSLDDRYPFFTFQCSCLNGAPENSNNLGYALLKRGAIATDSASRVSWYYQGQVDYTDTDSNAGMTYHYAIKLVRNHMACGDAHYGMLLDVPQDIWMNHLVFNLYGDPSVSYAAGPLITHTPLQDTDNNTQPYTVTAGITSNGPLAASNPAVYWNTNGGAAFNKVVMTLVSGVTYKAQIPAQPTGSTVYYYVGAQDAQGRTGSSPTSAPGTLHSFKVRADTQSPVIQHTPLTNTGDTAGPYAVEATVTDDCGISSVVLRYSINGGAEIDVPMSAQGANVYLAMIPGPTSQGDEITYCMVATDTSLAYKTARWPASGYCSFSISTVRVAVYDSAAVPTYFIGSNSNVYSTVLEALSSDTKLRFTPVAITSLTAADLADKDALVLPDNGVATADLASVLSWFAPGKVIVTMDSSASYAGYSGLLWPASAGSAGFGIYWDQNAKVDDQEIVVEDPVTSGYDVGEVIKSRGYGAQFYTDKLPADAVVLAVSSVANRAYAVYRDVPGAGRFVALGPYRPLEAAQYSMLREAIAVKPESPGTPIAVVKGIPDGQTVKLASVVVTCGLSGSAYVQDQSRLAGIRVSWAQSIPLGALATISGTVTTANGERVLTAQSVTTSSAAAATPRPLAMTAGRIGGGARGYQPAVTEYRRSESASPVAARGLSNVGLLVRFAGKVTTTGTGFFYVDDGSKCDDGSGYVGVRVISGSFAKPAVGARVIVTGVSSTFFERGHAWRAVIMPEAASVRVL